MLLLCYSEKGVKYKFWMTWGWINDFFYFWITNPLTITAYTFRMTKERNYNFTAFKKMFLFKSDLCQHCLCCGWHSHDRSGLGVALRPVTATARWGKPAHMRGYTVPPADSAWEPRKPLSPPQDSPSHIPQTRPGQITADLGQSMVDQNPTTNLCSLPLRALQTRRSVSHAGVPVYPSLTFLVFALPRLEPSVTFSQFRSCLLLAKQTSHFSCHAGLGFRQRLCRYMTNVTPCISTFMQNARLRLRCARVACYSSESRC